MFYILTKVRECGYADMAMIELTKNAMAEIEREKDFSPEETLLFLRERKNFMSVSEGIKRELRRLGYAGNDVQLRDNFLAIMKEKGINSSEFKQEKKWFSDKALPSPKSAVRLCFAFGLNKEAALNFLWKVCHVNGFNSRRAEDVIYCYCLDNGKSYSEAVNLIARYNKQTANQSFEVYDYTKRTQLLRSVFNDLAAMDESEFFKKLCENKKNFIQYSVTANEEFTRICANLKENIRKDAGKDEVSLYAEIIYAFEEINHAAKVTKNKITVFKEIIGNFPQSRYLNEMFKKASAATDKEHDKARKVFVLVYFADYSLSWSSYLNDLSDRIVSPEEFYSDFYISLNDMLEKCGYGKLYPANPFDWLILNCVKSLDVNDQSEDLNPIELFNEVLIMLADERIAGGLS